MYIYYREDSDKGQRYTGDNIVFLSGADFLASDLQVSPYGDYILGRNRKNFKYMELRIFYTPLTGLCRSTGTVSYDVCGNSAKIGRAHV